MTDGEPDSGAPGAAGGSVFQRGLERALRLPLFYKIVLANSTIIALAVASGVLLSPGPGLVEPGHPIFQVVAPLIVVGVAASALVNALIVRLALDPLRSLEEAAARVERGNLNARAPRSPLADPDLGRLIDAFNEVLAAAAAYRRRLRKTAARSQRAEEEERRRVARALHDDTAQRLAGLLLRLRLVESRGGGVDEVRTLLEEARVEVAAAVEVVRHYALGRRPPSLDELGLGAAIESYADEVLPDLDAPVRLAFGGDGSTIAPVVELALFRIVQEALDNVARHSGASRVEVSIEEDGEVLKAVVEDDGRGFDVEATLEEECLGFSEMRERAAAVGGEVEFVSASGSGTRVEASLPVEPFEEVDE